MTNKNYTRKLIDDYCVIDTETTGLSSYYDEIIEIGIAKVRDGNIVDQYSQLIKPDNEIDEFITALTGITNEMVSNMPNIMDIKSDVIAFIGDDLLVGHNTSFDMRFLSAGFNEAINNEYIDTVQFAKKLYTELDHHRLSDLSSYLGLSTNEHRALADCVTTYELYERIKTTMNERNLDIHDLW